MIENTSARRFSCFNLAIAILVLLFIATIGLLIMIVPEAWHAEQVYNDKRDEFNHHYNLWHSQRIQEYEVIYNNCRTGVCCEDATMIVAEEIVQSLAPDCSAMPGLQDHDRYVRTMNDFYYWLDTKFLYSDSWEILEVEYHPELHYITSLVWQEYDVIPPVEIRYEDLRPLDESETSPFLAATFPFAQRTATAIIRAATATAATQETEQSISPTPPPATQTPVAR